MSSRFSPRFSTSSTSRSPRPSASIAFSGQYYFESDTRKWAGKVGSIPAFAKPSWDRAAPFVLSLVDCLVGQYGWRRSATLPKDALFSIERLDQSSGNDSHEHSLVIFSLPRDLAIFYKIYRQQISRKAAFRKLEAIFNQSFFSDYTSGRTPIHDILRIFMACAPGMITLREYDYPPSAPGEVSLRQVSEEGIPPRVWLYHHQSAMAPILQKQFTPMARISSTLSCERRTEVYPLRTVGQIIKDLWDAENPETRAKFLSESQSKRHTVQLYLPPIMQPVSDLDFAGQEVQLYIPTLTSSYMEPFWAEDSSLLSFGSLP
ncbi:hypothetical protein SISNIDRAFT_450234 [Sistotremastrum niveocremeum HHB9708]|uniref:Uncharacterized protein n=1 Tax=Sistotremastrum niveocremeum HHB9708 TaxID=1314777 RepID=A0A164Z1A8_9AGAM|nr:hypothetical protein SISNIDRAFT_450234 [Sistotremastrum niveocremeum HHB9708]